MPTRRSLLTAILLATVLVFGASAAALGDDAQDYNVGLSSKQGFASCAGHAQQPIPNGNRLRASAGQVCVGPVAHQSILVCLNTSDYHTIKCETKNRSGPGPLNVSPEKVCSYAQNDHGYRSVITGTFTVADGRTAVGRGHSSSIRVHLNC